MTTRSCGSLSSLDALWELLMELLKNTHAHKYTQSIRQLKIRERALMA